MKLKKTVTLSRFITVLKTLVKQGYIDPSEYEYDLTEVFDFLVTSQIAEAVVRFGRRWLKIRNPDACRMLVDLLESATISMVAKNEQMV